MAELETIRADSDVERILQFAKLSRSDFKPTVQCVSFEPALDNECVRLMEVDQTVLNQLKEGSTIHFRGRNDDSAVICTDDKTFDVKMRETSNTLLIVPDLLLPESLPNEGGQQLVRPEVLAMKRMYLELTSCRPHLERLKHLLEENTYNGWEYEEDEHHQGKKYTMSELLTVIQASRQELLEGLYNLHACEIKGFWRMLNFDFMTRVFEEILKLVDEQSWSIDSVPEEDCCNILEDLFPRAVVSHILRAYSKPVVIDDQEMEGQYRLDEDKICRLYAEIIVKTSERFHLDNFMSIWKQSVPDGMSTSPEQLEGLGLIDSDSTPPVFRYFPVENLPENVEERFNALFREKTKWTLAEITPYVKDITTDKLNVGSLLMKYGRGSTENGIKMYSSKRPVPPK